MPSLPRRTTPVILRTEDPYAARTFALDSTTTPHTNALGSQSEFNCDRDKLYVLKEIGRKHRVIQGEPRTAQLEVKPRAV